MTIQIRKQLPTELEQQYAAMRKQSDGNNGKPNMVNNAAAESNANLPTDKITLSSKQPDSENLPRVIRSQSVSPIEKQALQAHFSVRV